MNPEARQARLKKYAARRARKGLDLPYDRLYVTGNCGVYSKGRSRARVAAARLIHHAQREGASVVYLCEVDGVDIRALVKRFGDRWHVHQPSGTVGNCAVLVRKAHGRIVRRRFVQLSGVSREGMWKVPIPVGARYAVVCDVIWDEDTPNEVAETLCGYHLGPERTPLARAAGAARLRLIRGRKCGDSNYHGPDRRVIGAGVGVELFWMTMPRWWPRTVRQGKRLFKDPTEHFTMRVTARFKNPRPATKESA